MVIREDGTKWACQSCLKGHRVSGCNHTDRPLQFVPKKGRPVTQCQHCRVERKKRSAHVKCECGEKQHSKEKCIHLRSQEEAHADSAKTLGPVPEGEESDEHTCCCHHGEKCTCSTLKKEAGQQSNEHTPSSAHVRKPRLTSTQSDSHLTSFANSHHKPLHRTNHSSHDVNAPYRVHKPQAAHGLHVSARRSVDSLASLEKASKLSKTQLQQLTSTSTATSQADLRPASQLAPVTSYSAYSIPVDSNTPSGADDFFPAASEQRSMSGFQQPQLANDLGNGVSWDGFDWNAIAENPQPALTYASSNTISELGDHTPPDDVGSMFFMHNVGARLEETSTQLNQMSDSSSSSSAQPQPNAQSNRWSLPPSFFTDSSANATSDSQSQWLPFVEQDGMSAAFGVPSGIDMSQQQLQQHSPTVPSAGSQTSAPAQTKFVDGYDFSVQFDMSQQYDFQSMALSAASDPSAFDVASAQDSQGMSYQTGGEDAFFGLASAGSVDFGTNEYQTTGFQDGWPS